MRISILFCTMLLASIASHAQFTYKIKADSVKITNDSCSAELILENATKHVNGFLFNYGDGRTEFRAALTQVNDTVYVIGSDTLFLPTGMGSVAAWWRSGNAGTNPATQFLGTSDSVRVVFRTNNTERATLLGNGNFLIGTSTNANYKLDVVGNMRISEDSRINGLKIGKGPGNFTYNTMLGLSALDSNTTGIYNTAIGNLALRNNTTGRINTAVGYGTLPHNTTGENNTAIGANSLYANTTGSNNTGVGYRTLGNNTTGGNNTAVGYNAIPNNTTGTQNTAVGRNAMANNTTGGSNTAMGYVALAGNTTGTGNSAFGINALFTNTTGSNNTAIGNTSLFVNTTGHSNNALGAGALRYNTTGYLNNAVGFNALRENTTGYYNVAMGGSSMIANTVGFGNTAVGHGALPSNDSGSNNLAMGYFSLRYNKAGEWNSAAGVNSLQFNTFGSQNTVSGGYALNANTTGNGNTGMGYESLLSKSTGNYNVALGYRAGSSLTTGDNNIFIGNNVQPNISTTASNQLNIGNAIYGNNGRIGIGLTNPGAKLHLAAGGSGSNEAPLKMESGSLMSTPESGSVEYDGTNYYASSGGNRYTLAKTLTQTASLNFASTSAGTSSDLTISVTGASDGDAVSLAVPSGSVLSNSSYSAFVSGTNTVTVRFNNYSSGTLDPDSGSFRVVVIKY